MNNKPKILLLDIETAPLLSHIWGRWNQNIPTQMVIQDTYILCWSAKWLDSDEIMVDSLHYHKRFKSKPEDDSIILKTMWKLMDEADIIIGHNGDNFDIKRLNSRFIQNDMSPPSPYRTMDTLKVARNSFGFTSNKLDDLGQYLKVGRKIDTGGYKLWRDIVIDNCFEAFDRMVEYNEQDVYLLEDVYNALKSWDKKHINLAMYSDLGIKTCIACGSDRIKKNGKYRTDTQTYQRYKCNDCGKPHRSRKAEKKTKEQNNNLLKGL